jgi:PEP-CTERM motif-containing protein
MGRSLIKWLAGAAIAISQSVSAAPITDTVIVGTQEWAQVDLFTNVSWATLNSQCPGGVCSLASTVNGYDLNGWTWASVQDVQTMFDVFTGQSTPAPTRYIELDSTWAPLMFSLFNPTEVSTSGVLSLRGYSSTPWVGNSVYTPLVRDRSSYDETYSENTNGNAGADIIGAWFLRPAAQVPAPATLALFGLGLASLGVFGRKRATKVS